MGDDAQGCKPRHPRDLVGPGACGIDQDRAAENATVGRDLPVSGRPLDGVDPHRGVDDRAAGACAAQEAGENDRDIQVEHGRI